MDAAIFCQSYSIRNYISMLNQFDIPQLKTSSSWLLSILGYQPPRSGLFTLPRNPTRTAPSCIFGERGTVQIFLWEKSNHPGPHAAKLGIRCGGQSLGAFGPSGGCWCLGEWPTGKGAGWSHRQNGGSCCVSIRDLRCVCGCDSYHTAPQRSMAMVSFRT